MKDIKTLIQEHPFFAGLDAASVELIAALRIEHAFRSRRISVSRRRSGEPILSVAERIVRLETAVPGRAPVVLETIRAGEVIGWSWLFPPYLWQFDAQAVENVRATVFDGKCLRGKCQEDHDLGYELAMRSAHIMMQRLQATRLQLLDVYGPRA